MPDTVHARAAMVIGAGSASFLILRHLVERLPAMVCPRWIDTRTQPIAIRDVVGALAALADPATPAPSEVQLGGADVLSYREMMHRYAAAAGRRAPLVVRVPVLTPRLSSYWLGARDPGRHRRRAPAGAGAERRDARAHARRRPGSTTRRWASTTPYERPWPKTRGRLLPCPPSSSPVAALLAAAVVGLRKVFVQALPEWLRIVRDVDDVTEIDRSTGAVRSVQSAEVVLPAERIDAMWSPQYLERLARTYWRFLTRATLGVIRVYYTEGERYVCLLFRPLVLLTFQAPEYEMDDRRGVVRWRIERGLLVARRGRGGDGYLEIDVERRPGEAARARSTSPSRSRWPTSTPPSRRA